MSVAARGYPELLRALAFSDPESELWGAVWTPPGSTAPLVLGAYGRARTLSGALEGERAEEAWRLETDEGELVLEGLAESGEAQTDPQGGFDQLCRVSGELVIEDQPREFSCLGWRSVRAAAVLLGDVDSVRQVAAWLGPEYGFALLARRSARAKGQDADTVSAALFGLPEARTIVDPRLSTTYTETGDPIRAGVELWLQAGDDPEQQYPRRALGQATHAPTSWPVDGFTMQALPFHWHVSGQEGPGIYFLGQRS